RPVRGGCRRTRGRRGGRARGRGAGGARDPPQEAVWVDAQTPTVVFEPELTRDLSSWTRMIRTFSSAKQSRCVIEHGRCPGPDVPSDPRRLATSGLVRFVGHPAASSWTFGFCPNRTVSADSIERNPWRLKKNGSERRSANRRILPLLLEI